MPKKILCHDACADRDILFRTCESIFGAVTVQLRYTENKFGLCDYILYICGMRLILIMFVLMSCGKPIVDCKCNDEFVFENTFDTSLCNQPIKETIQYRYYLQKCPPPIGNILIIDSIFETHKGFKRYIVH